VPALVWSRLTELTHLDFLQIDNEDYEVDGPIKCKDLPRQLLCWHNASLRPGDSLHLVPRGLQEISFRGEGNRHLDLRALPDTLLTLSMPETAVRRDFRLMRRFLDNQMRTYATVELPAGLLTLNFASWSHWERDDIVIYPVGLTALTLSPDNARRWHSVQLPPTLTRLDYGAADVILDNHVMHGLNLDYMSIRISCETHAEAIQTIRFFPQRIRHLCLTVTVDQWEDLLDEVCVDYCEFIGLLPRTITTLELSIIGFDEINVKHDLASVWPPHLYSLAFTCSPFKLPQPSMFPSSVRKLTLCTPSSDEDTEQHALALVENSPCRQQFPEHIQDIHLWGVDIIMSDLMDERI
jgi:hypothetical protein